MSQEYSPSDRADSVGLNFLVGLDGPILTDNDKRVLNAIKPCGILLTSRNFLPGSYKTWLAGIEKLLKGVIQYSERERFIISLDHEGGVFHRAPAPITHFPAPYIYRNDVCAVAKAMCQEVKSFGINTLWAPLADVNWNPKNPVIGDRAFGSTVAETLTPIRETVFTYREHGILSCAKHYPGHGGTSEDSHYTLPYLDCTKAELLTRDLAPFQAAIQAGVPMLMTAHILFPKIDATVPATMSKIFLEEIARKELGFQGVIVADNVNMDSVARAFMYEDGLEMAINASVDVIMVSDNTMRAVGLAETLIKSRNYRRVTDESLAKSQRRIRECLAPLNAPTFHQLDEDELACNQELARCFLES